uniref:XK-related protein n=1 Tax=Cynoglossus semilaevis TaxID=244447 RepID=A0A3P8VNH3_CYNSE
MEQVCEDTHTGFKFNFSKLDSVFAWLGLIVFLADIVLDFVTLVFFYQTGAYWRFSILLILILGSSVLVNTYSWLWYKYDKFEREMAVETCLSPRLFHVVHVFQLGFFFPPRLLTITGLTLCLWRLGGGYAVYRSHDFCFLKLIEAFSENSPQLLLMLTSVLHQHQAQLIQVWKALASACGIALGVTMYHRSLRSFLPDKANQKVASSLVYFSWNLFLISSRLVALALFASVLPWFIFAHFLCSWLVLFFCAWRCQTSFMDSSAGEWLFRATVGLIWYFNWLNVAKGRTRNRTLLYHGYMLLDICLLCRWFWKMSTESNLEKSIAVSVVVVVYVLGLILKVIYYKCIHPTLSKEKATTEDGGVLSKGTTAEEPEDTEVTFRSLPGPPTPSVEDRSRMRKLAEIFYS